MMTALQRKAFDVLTDALWSGEIGEVEYVEHGLELGASLEQINTVMSEVREEDGTWGM